MCKQYLSFSLCFYLGILQSLTNGYINYLFKCSLKTASLDMDDNRALVVRVFGEVKHFNRESEVELMNLASEGGVIPALHCR